MSKIRNLEERVERLSEVERERRSAAFAAYWTSLSGSERQMVDAILGEVREFEALYPDPIVLEEKLREWHDAAPLEKRAVMDGMLSWDPSWDPMS